MINHSNSMVAMRSELKKIMFVVTDFGCYDAEVANLKNSVVASHKHVISNFGKDVEGCAVSSRDPRCCSSKAQL